MSGKAKKSRQAADAKGQAGDAFPAEVYVQLGGEGAPRNLDAQRTVAEALLEASPMVDQPGTRVGVYRLDRVVTAVVTERFVTNAPEYADRTVLPEAGRPVAARKRPVARAMREARKRPRKAERRVRR